MEKRQSNHAAAAAAIRAQLKKAGIKARVRSRSFSMGDAVDVDIYADLMPAARKEVEAFVDQFQYGHFDGSDDSYRYSNHRDDLPQVKYAHVNVHYSEEILAAVREYVAGIQGIEEYRRHTYEWPVLNGSWGDFWRDRKPRVRAAA